MTPKRRNILLAYDGSQHAQSAVELLLNTPHPPNSRIFVLRAFSPSQVDHLTGFEKALQRIKEQLEEKGFRVDTDLQLGSAAEKIVETAQIRKPDLIVLGAKGLRATLGILLGGVAQQVVEYASHPVLVVRAPYTPLERILLVTDGSPHSERTAEFLGEFPLPMSIDIHVMHVLPPLPIRNVIYSPSGEPVLYEPPAVSEIDKAELAREERIGNELLERTIGQLGNYGIRSVPVLKRGDAATEIMDILGVSSISSRGEAAFLELTSRPAVEILRRLELVRGVRSVKVLGSRP